MNDMVEDSSHGFFTKYGRGEFNGPVLTVKQGKGAFKVSGTPEYCSMIGEIIASSASCDFDVKGSIFSKSDFRDDIREIGLDFEDKTKKGYFIANFKSVIEPGLLKPVYQAIPDGYVFLSLKGDKPWSINAGKKPPKPGGKIKETFFKASLGLESLDMLREELLFDVEGDFTEVRIENTYIIDEIVVPSDIKNASEARIHAKRKGKIRRKVTVDGVENTTEKEMIV